VRGDDAYADPRFNPEDDRETGFRTRNLLCLPLVDRHGEVFAVAPLLNAVGRARFDEEDEQRFRRFLDSMGVILEGWRNLTPRAPDPGA